MGIRFSGTLLAAVTVAFVIAPGLSALAQFNPSGFGGTGQATGQGKSSTSDRMGGGGGRSVSSGRSVSRTTNRSASRMGGGGGKGSAKRSKNLNSGRSN